MAEYKADGIDNQPELLFVDPFNEQEDERSAEVSHQAFGNSLIVELVCSYVSAVADLRNLRLVNHTFQSAATKKLRRVHKEIVLFSEFQIQTLVDCTKSRNALNLTPFPFTSFRVSLFASLETLENFCKTVAHHITRYSFELHSWFYAEHTVKTTKFVTLLSHSTELVALKIFSNIGLVLTKEDLDRFPSAFPHLSTLRISGPHYQPETETVNHFPLIDLLVIRAPQLQKIHIPQIDSQTSTRVFRSIIQNQNRPDTLPNFFLEAHPYFSTFIGKVIDMDLTFTDLAIPTFALNREQARTMIRRLCTWLETQTNILINLSIDIFSYQNQVQGSFRFPELQALKNLKLMFPYEEYLLEIPYSRHIQPFVGNPFPSLRKLCLEHYREEFELFGPCSMPSVHELHLRYQRTSFSDPSWSIWFPNLITLHIEFDRELPEVFHSILGYILTHLTRLEHLDLDIASADDVIASADDDVLYPYEEPDSSWCSWNLLTDRAPKSFRKLILSEQEFSNNLGAAAEKPANGIYTVPSLSNMKNLKTLRIFPRLKSNLDAIVYMSRKGLLCPLQKLVLCLVLGDMGPRLTEDEKTAYKNSLLSVHKEVVLWK